LAERRRAGFPPFAYQALLRAEASKLDIAIDFLEQAATTGRVLSVSVQIYDPVPAPKARIAGRHHAQLLVQARVRKHLQAFLDVWCPSLGALAGRRVRWGVDVDPIEL
jgi:primosomal protein N' (replication factor Y)